MLMSAPNCLALLVVVHVLAFFFLLSGSRLQKKLVEMIPGLPEKQNVVEIASKIEQTASRYFSSVRLINASVGLSVWILVGIRAGILITEPCMVNPPMNLTPECRLDFPSQLRGVVAHNLGIGKCLSIVRRSDSTFPETGAWAWEFRKSLATTLRTGHSANPEAPLQAPKEPARN